MTFQRTTALTIARLLHAIRPASRIVVGGYDPSLAPDEYEFSADVDFIVRGEGGQTLDQGESFPAAARHSPLFVLRHGQRSWRTRSPAAA